MFIGKVAMFNSKRGFGFIDMPTNGEKKNIYFHCSDIHPQSKLKTITRDDYVAFNLKKGPKGLNAVNVCYTSEIKDPKYIFEHVDPRQRECQEVDLFLRIHCGKEYYTQNAT